MRRRVFVHAAGGDPVDRLTGMDAAEGDSQRPVWEAVVGYLVVEPVARATDVDRLAAVS